MSNILVTRSVSIPDELRISRYEKNPELGPRVLFFSGGSALNGVARKLKRYTHNSIHLVTPFDSGGSSAVIREFFDMPAVGDLRSRLMALADETVLGHPEITRLFDYRFPKSASNKALRVRLEAMIAGEDKLTKAISNPMRTLICNHLGYFFKAMPSAFDLRGASIGNLIIVGGYINHHRQLDPIIFLFSELVNVQGTVRAITEDNYHLAAELEDGTQVIGQHQLTGKETAPITSPIKKLRLSADIDSMKRVETKLKKRNKKLISQAELICYPPGSFYTSLAANLLPYGVSESIANNPSPKIYIPNLGHDPEQTGMTLLDQVETILARLQGQFTSNVEVSRLLNFVLLDDNIAEHDFLSVSKSMAKLDVQVIRTSLTNNPQDQVYAPEKLVKAIMSLV